MYSVKAPRVRERRTVAGLSSSDSLPESSEDSSLLTAGEVEVAVGAERVAVVVVALANAGVEDNAAVMDDKGTRTEVLLGAPVARAAAGSETGDVMGVEDVGAAFSKAKLVALGVLEFAPCPFQSN